MQRIGTLTALLVILMAGFMSVCAADENCATEATHVSMHKASDIHASSASTQDTKQEHCGMLCHVAPHNLPQTMANTFKSHHIVQDRITSTDDTISLSHYTVLDQPPRA
ncbi:MAG: hypothetical protein EOP52_13645 [Sphingobacteriales bacterium]|nr:MAG: hypothetical protein EOP52_13645 [Sphingobacteriales bacterium]